MRVSMLLVDSGLTLPPPVHHSCLSFPHSPSLFSLLLLLLFGFLDSLLNTLAIAAWHGKRVFGLTRIALVG